MLVLLCLYEGENPWIPELSDPTAVQKAQNIQSAEKEKKSRNKVYPH